MSDPRDDENELQTPKDGAPIPYAAPARGTPEYNARRMRNIVLALGLIVFVILIFFVTIVRLGANVLDPRF